MEGTAEAIKYRFARKWGECKYAGALSCLDATKVGIRIAAAAAEALYGSELRFGVDAKIISSFLQRCPLSLAVKPGKYIQSLHLYMDEDPNFIGDGGNGQGLRKKDWVDLASNTDDDRTARSGDRTQLMRQCWRDILDMPKLKLFEFWIMPSQGKTSACNIKRWEIGDIIPMHFRLACRDIDASICLRTWEAYQEPINNKFELRFYQENHSYPDDDGCVESFIDVSRDIPYKWAEPTAYQRARAKDASMLRDTTPDRYGLFGDSLTDAIRNYDTLQEYLGRLDADKSMSMVHSTYVGTFANES